MIMQTILTAIAEGNLRMGMERMEHNSELEDAMNRVCRLEKELSATLNDSEKELLEKLDDEKITIGEPQDVDGERIQEVKIYYKFIGCISQEGHIC